MIHFQGKHLEEARSLGIELPPSLTEKVVAGNKYSRSDKEQIAICRDVMDMIAVGMLSLNVVDNPGFRWFIGKRVDSNFNHITRNCLKEKYQSTVRDKVRNQSF